MCGNPLHPHQTIQGRSKSIDDHVGTKFGVMNLRKDFSSVEQCSKPLLVDDYRRLYYLI